MNFMKTVVGESTRRAQEASYGRAMGPLPSAGPDELTDRERSFIESRDSFYIASITENGWPYIQHRGGPAGFLRVLDPSALAFADLSGNRQLISTANVQVNKRVSLFLMDYPQKERLKIIGTASIIPAAEADSLAREVAPEGIPARFVERIFKIEVVGYDWNCPKYITPRYTQEQVEAGVKALQDRIGELEQELSVLRRNKS